MANGKSVCELPERESESESERESARKEERAGVRECSIENRETSSKLRNEGTAFNIDKPNF